MVEARIERLPEKKLVGLRASMSASTDTTSQLWRGLMPRLGEIDNRTTTSYVSMRVYGKPGMSPDEMFAPATLFEKWAAVEVDAHDAIPDGMSRYTLGGGLYAVFVHRGPASAFSQTMRQIFGTWLPGSQYELDDREQFEVLPEGWTATDPDGTEEIWIPIRPRSP